MNDRRSTSQHSTIMARVSNNRPSGRSVDQSSPSKVITCGCLRSTKGVTNNRGSLDEAPTWFRFRVKATNRSPQVCSLQATWRTPLILLAPNTTAMAKWNVSTSCSWGFPDSHRSDDLTGSGGDILPWPTWTAQALGSTVLCWGLVGGLHGATSAYLRILPLACMPCVGEGGVGAAVEAMNGVRTDLPHRLCPRTCPGKGEVGWGGTGERPPIPHTPRTGSSAAAQWAEGAPRAGSADGSRVLQHTARQPEEETGGLYRRHSGGTELITCSPATSQLFHNNGRAILKAENIL